MSGAVVPVSLAVVVSVCVFLVVWWLVVGCGTVK